MKKRLPLILIFIFSMILLIINTHQNFSPPEATKQVAATKLSYSWQIFNSTSWQVDKMKPTKKQLYLLADAIYYKNETHESLFISPYLIQQTPDDILFVKSKNGNSSNEQIIELNGHVNIDNYSMITKQNKTLKSEQITYNTQTEMLHSKVLTEIQTPDLNISGIGFDANLKQNRYDFKSNVKTHYQPKDEQ